MKRLFMLRDARGREIMQVDGQRPLFFDSKAVAKAHRDALNANAGIVVGATALATAHTQRHLVTVTYGPDHDLFNHYSFSPQRRRRALSKRAHRTQANMGRPQPQKHAARIERIAPLFRKD